MCGAPLVSILSIALFLVVTPPPARLSLHPLTPPVILHRLQPHAATEPVITLLLLSICDSTAAFSHLRVVPVRDLAFVHRLAASVRRGQQTRVIGRGLYVESLTAGTHEVHGRTQGKFLLIKLKKCFLHLTAGTHRLYLRTEGSASLFCEKNYSSR